jgi:hypothetical protein
LSTNWQLKIQTPCSVCSGKNNDCSYCNGTGKVFETIKPSKIDTIIGRPEKQSFACVGCRKKEDILRPLPNQTPYGWLNWSGDLICFECKSKVLLAAIVAAEQKVRQLKETK